MPGSHTKPLTIMLKLENSSKSALAEHVCETSHNIAWEDSKIITTNNRYGQRLCLEAWHINASPCALNRDDGSHLPQEYLIYILLVDDVTLTAYKAVSFNIRPPLMKTLDRSVETLGRECNLCSVITFSFESRVPAFGVEYEIAYFYISILADM